ncbi:hypothetical protein [Flavobacterium sp. GT3R68]|uniref:hypothetical protein n=1 Tax=Flavobacterium sp. GT3R68 TaxID=2594437 RepID=UPI000F8694FB|nr:hypothetical protein [Flavobacterium sp. GT3R68]RTY95078.1 hypothetical protein EKL32_09175 [Flavobacterium sp. GSN2]TRW91884.1 hypothetical protein FNW07_08350 [Flavobacterium sp. GT3R68]
MKKLKFLLFIPLLCAMQCEPEGPCGDNPTSNYVLHNNLISIETNGTTYHVGDTIWINAVVNKNQSDANSSQNINLFNFDNKLNFNVNLLKTSSYNQNFPISLNENHVVSDKGEVMANSFIMVKEGDNFVNRTGIKLLETGTFKINCAEISSYRDYYDCTTRTYIGTTISNADSENYYNFIVE